MKPSLKNLFSLSVLDTDYFNNSQDKIELIGCKQTVKKCELVLPALNESHREVMRYKTDKDFQRAIIVLKNAFNRTFELKEPACSRCGDLFRSTIIETLEDIHNELKTVSTGIFKTKRYLTGYLMSAETLMEFEKIINNNNISIQNENNRQMHQILNKKVS